MARNPREPYNAPAQFEPAPTRVAPLEIGAPDVRGLSSTLEQWRREEQAKLEKKAKTRQKDIATRQQREAGTDELVEPPDVAERFQRAHQAQAEEVLNQQIQSDALVARTRIANENRFDPEAFQKEWDAYVQGQYETFKDQDQRFADEVALTLSEVGSRQQANMLNTKAARERRNQAALLEEAREQQRTALVDDLRNNPSKEKLEEYKFRQIQSVKSQHEMGLMSGAEREKAIAQADTEMEAEYLRGQFNKAMDPERGGKDIAGATTIVKGLLSGSHFDHDPSNETSRRLGEELAKRLGESKTEFDLGYQREKLDRATNEVWNGQSNPLSDGALTRIEKMHQQFGDSDDLREFRERKKELALAQTVRQQIKTTPRDQLGQFREEFSQKHSQWVSEAFTDNLDKYISDRRTELAQAEENQDRVSVAWDSGDTIGTVSYEEAIRKRKQAAQAYGVSPDEVNLLPKSQIEKITDRVQSMRGEDAVEDYAKISNDLAEVYGGDPRALLGDIANWEEAGGGNIAAPLVVDMLGNRNAAKEMTKYIADGNAYADEDLGELQEGTPNFKAERDLYQTGKVADFLNNFEGSIRSQFKGTVETLFRGIVTKEDYDTDAAIDEIERLVSPLTESFTYGPENAKKNMPLAFMGPAVQQHNAVRERVERDIQEKFDKPQKELGLSANNATLVEDITIEVGPGGKNVQFRLPQTNELIRDRNQDGDPDEVLRNGKGEPVQVSLEPKRPVEDLPAVGIGENFEKAFRTFQEKLDLASGTIDRASFNNMTAPESEKLSNAVWHAADVGEETAVELAKGGSEVEQRVGGLLVPRNVDGRYDSGDSPTGKAPSVATEDGARIHAAALVDEARRTFPNDPEAQLATYVFGDPEFVKDLREGTDKPIREVLESQNFTEEAAFIERGMTQYSEENIVANTAESIWDISPHKMVVEAPGKVVTQLQEWNEAAVKQLQENNESMGESNGEE